MNGLYNVVLIQSIRPVLKQTCRRVKADIVLSISIPGTGSVRPLAPKMRSEYEDLIWKA